MPYSLSIAESIKEAETAINSDNLSKAAVLYEKHIKRKPGNERAYNRLMIIYRKQKAFRKELLVINAAIKDITNAYHAKGQELFGKNSSVKRLSNDLMKSLGLQSAGGKNLYVPEIVERWERRKGIVLKKLAKG